jgi:hypothetical protein
MFADFPSDYFVLAALLDEFIEREHAIRGLEIRDKELNAAPRFLGAAFEQVEEFVVAT